MGETKTNQPLNRVALLLRYRDLVNARGQWRIVVTAALAQQTEKLVRILRDELSKLRIPCAELRKDGLEHARLLLYHLPQLLELGVVAKEVEVA